jgi:competence protein ComEC
MQAAPYGAVLAGLALAWLAGVGAQLQQPALWPQQGYALALAVAAFGLLLAARSKGLRLALALALPAAALAGLAATGLHAGARLADSLAAELEGRDLTLTGVVASMPQAGANGLRFRFDVEQAALAGQAVRVPHGITLGWYRGSHEDAALTQPQSELRAGQRWRFAVRLRQPHGNANPHGFDYELMLFEQGIRATGYVRDAEPPLRLHDAAGHPVERLRQQVRDAIFAQVSDAAEAGVLAALAVGDQAAIGRDDWDLFRTTGVAHLMSISGLHVTMFAWLAGLLVTAAWRRSARAMLWLAAQQAARWGGVAAALGYAVFSGWGVPSQRTVWMLVTVALLQSLGRRWPWPLVLLAAAVVVTLGDPWALLQPGFWLSFMAVGLLMSSEFVHGGQANAATRRPWGYSVASRAWRGVRSGLRTQLIATVGLTPLSLVFFQQVSLVGFFANLLAIPLVTVVITPLALLGTLVPPLWALAAWTVKGLVAWLAWLASLPSAVWFVPVAPLWAQLAALLAALLLVLPLPWRLRLLAVPLALPLLLPPRALPGDGQFDVTVADVGQGSAVLLRTRSHLLVYDTGPQYSRDSDAGQRVLLPLLRAIGETRIDVLMLSHRDSDHIGGAASLLGALPVAQLYSSLAPDAAPFGDGVPQRRCQAGQQWQWDGVAFEVLHPAAQDYERSRKPNAMSCVLRVRAGDASILLTGDIEAEQEAALASAYGDALHSELLVVPHHGSRSSSSTALLDAVQPRIALVQAGYRNRFGHPAPEVVRRYVERGIALRLSPACGAWRREAGEAPAGHCQRETVRRYWHHGGAPDPSSPLSGPPDPS